MSDQHKFILIDNENICAYIFDKTAGSELIIIDRKTTPQTTARFDLGENGGVNAAIAKLSEPTIIVVSDNKTLGLSDGLTLQKVAATSAITIPPESSVAFPVGTRIDVVSYVATDVSFVAGSGVTIRSKDAKLKIDGQYAAATIIKIAADEWVLIGALKA